MPTAATWPIKPFLKVSEEKGTTHDGTILRAIVPFFCRGRHVVKNNIVYILCKDILYTLCKHILYTLCKHIVYKFLLIEALIFLLNEDRCESDKPVSSGILAYLRQSSR